jgi:hypothetical protein
MACEAQLSRAVQSHNGLAGPRFFLWGIHGFYCNGQRETIRKLGINMGEIWKEGGLTQWISGYN